MFQGLQFSMPYTTDNKIIIYDIPACLLMKEPNNLPNCQTPVVRELTEVIQFFAFSLFNYYLFLPVLLLLLLFLQQLVMQVLFITKCTIVVCISFG